MLIGYYVPVFLMRIVLKLFSRLEVRGKENVPPTGPLVMVSNHLSMVDPPLLAACFDRRIVFIAKEEAFNHPIMGPFTRGFGSISIRRGQVDRQALKAAGDTLSQGLALGVFPEGTRSRTGQLQKGHAGAALLAIRAGAPVLPVAITGTEKIKGPISVLKRPRIIVTIGKPFMPPAGGDKGNGKRLDEFTEEIMEHIAELLPVSYRGDFAALVATP